MNRWLFVVVFSGLVAFALTLAVNYATVLGHEDAHVAINRYYGVNSTATVWFSGGSFAGLTMPDQNAKLNDSAMLAHSVNEAVGYNSLPFVLVFTFLFGWFVLFNIMGGAGK